MPLRSRSSTITRPDMERPGMQRPGIEGLGMEKSGRTRPEMEKPRKEDGKTMPAVHPGEMLLEEFMKPLGLSANALAIALRVPVTRISEIVRERRGITADTALRLARYFNMSPEFWMRRSARRRA